MTEDSTPIPPLAPLYVDGRADIRNRAIVLKLIEFGVIKEEVEEELRIIATTAPEDSYYEYEGQGTLDAPFLTLEAAREVQLPGQSIVITGYATIGAASGA